MTTRTLYIAVTLLALGCGNKPAEQPALQPDAGTHSVRDVGSDLSDGAWSVADYVHVSEVGAVPEFVQREGNANRGYDVLVNEGYVSCGVPARIYDDFLGGDVPAGSKLPGRRNGNADMPFNQTRFDRDGIELVSTNCLFCHANVLPTGQLHVGLGYEGDYTRSLGRFVELGRGLVDETDEKEVFEYDRFLERTLAVQPHILMNTVGVNPANNIASVLTAHRDPDTWEWHSEPWFEVPAVDPMPLSVPPWWNVKKKNALYFTTVGRGDHARFMMAAALLCTDSLEEARRIDEMFVDVQAFIESLDAPDYPYRIDRTLADEGKAVFESTCSRCHGTYGAEETYPNLVISVEEVGTDPRLAIEGALSSDESIAWFNRSFFGELSVIAAAPGYIAPPLDGIWATAPYFHNASVPTVAGVLESSTRPAYWTRNFQVVDFDQDSIGFVHTVLPGGKDSAATVDEAKLIYDTTLPGYSNAGHTFADELSAEDRAALLEYLKTL